MLFVVSIVLLKEGEMIGEGIIIIGRSKIMEQGATGYDFFLDH